MYKVIRGGLLCWGLFGGVAAAAPSLPSLLPAPATLLGQGELQFHGNVVDTASLWRWRIASADQAWDVDVDEAQLDGQGVQRFSLTARGALPFLEGHLSQLLVQGAAGVTPRIVLASAEQPLRIDGGGLATDQRYRAALPVFDADSGEAIGQLTMTVEQALGVTHPAQPGLALLQGDSLSSVRPDALSGSLQEQLAHLLGRVEGAPALGLSGVLNGATVPQGVLSDSTVTRLAAVYGSQLSDFELSWPESKVPSQWRASLSVTVTLQ